MSIIEINGQDEIETAKAIVAQVGTASQCLYTERKLRLPKSQGFYFLFSGNECLYVGQSSNLWHRWFNHHIVRRMDDSRRASLIIKWLTYSPVEGVSVSGTERQIIRTLAPSLNSQEPWDVLSFNGVRLTWRESLAFNSQQDMAKAIGVSVGKLRHALSEARARSSIALAVSASDRLRLLIGGGTSKRWAAENGLSEATVSRILNGNRRPGAKVLRLIGLRLDDVDSRTEPVSTIATRPEWI